MQFIGDFHIHSSYSRATSKQLTPENLDLWARLKGINVLGTGDFTHPGWTADLREKLEPAEDGLFTLRPEYRIKDPGNGILPDGAAASGRMRFILTAEISSIYKYGDKVRKVHNLIFAPDFSAVELIQQKIEQLGGNIRSDGRPILGMDSRDLLELCLDADENIFFVPAHIWTPWFSALGAKSGFNSIKECYRDLSDHIYAVETGLSSDPPMNWMCSFLDKYTLISNSDAHSTEKLGREACLFDTGLSYGEITGAIKGGAGSGFRGTVEFFPQEGKYHFDGHRKCGISWDPLETLCHGSICPVCGKPVTMGVLSRIAQLADRKDITERPNRDPFYSLIPLKEIISEVEGVGPGTKRVAARYAECLNRLGSEFDILMYKEPDVIKKAAGTVVAEAVRLMRERRVEASPGFDGEYGRIRVWPEGGLPTEDAGGFSLFGADMEGRAAEAGTAEVAELLEFDLSGYLRAKLQQNGFGNSTATEPAAVEEAAEGGAVFNGLNVQQNEAADYSGGHSLIIAGPGTGKTRTVVEKISRLADSGAGEAGIIAVTFANKAAGELRERLESAEIHVCSEIPTNTGIGVFTFHSLGLSLLKPHLGLLGRSEAFQIIDEDDKQRLYRDSGCRTGSLSVTERKKLLAYFSDIKNHIIPMPEPDSSEFSLFRDYQRLLRDNDCFDYDDLVYLPLRLFETCPEILAKFRRRIGYVIVDEYQDINRVQYDLLIAISAEAEVCAVGDPNQSIYSFRGGSPEFIRHFQDDFTGAKLLPLSRSYRCPETILRASSQVIGGGEGFLAGQGPGVKINIVKTVSAASEAEQIARDIELRSGGMGFFSHDSGITAGTQADETALSDIAVLCRTTIQMTVIEKAFNDHRIPFRTIKTDSLFSSEPYRSFLAFVRFLSARGAGQSRPGDFGISQELLDETALPDRRGGAIELFCGLFTEGAERPDPKEMESELGLYWLDGCSAEEFVRNARMGSGTDRYDSRMQTVTIMTIHASKGLEFGLVYIPGCEDGIIPCTLTADKETDLEEEKRLLYVAMTRAKSELNLSCAGTRVIFGRTVEQKESPFLSAIEHELVERQRIEVVSRTEAHDNQLSLF